MNLDTIQHVANTSGGILYLMAVLLLVDLTIALERAWYLRRVLVAGNHVMQQLDSVTRAEMPMLRELSKHCSQLPHARVLDAVLKHDLNHHFDRLSDKMEEGIMREAPRVDRYLWVLDTIVTLAPLLGLLGTIHRHVQCISGAVRPGDCTHQGDRRRGGGLAGNRLRTVHRDSWADVFQRPE